jgi:hypothetical protein
VQPLCRAYAFAAGDEPYRAGVDMASGRSTKSAELRESTRKNTMRVAETQVVMTEHATNEDRTRHERSIAEVSAQ